MPGANPLTIKKLLAGLGAGTAVSAVENKLLLDDSSDNIQHMNLALGGATGAALSMAPGLKERAAILAAWPLKSMGLFGVDRGDKYIDTILPAARIQQDTAAIENDTARTGGASRTLSAAGTGALGAAGLTGAGALLYLLWKQRQKEKAREERQVGKGTTLVRGNGESKRKRVRIELPASSLPPAFFDSLVNVDDAPKADVLMKDPVKQACDLCENLFKRSNAEGVLGFVNTLRHNPQTTLNPGLPDEVLKDIKERKTLTTGAQARPQDNSLNGAQLTAGSALPKFQSQTNAK
jgi:hypothetical protein